MRLFDFDCRVLVTGILSPGSSSSLSLIICLPLKTTQWISSPLSSVTTISISIKWGKTPRSATSCMIRNLVRSARWCVASVVVPTQQAVSSIPAAMCHHESDRVLHHMVHHNHCRRRCCWAHPMVTIAWVVITPFCPYLPPLRCLTPCQDRDGKDIQHFCAFIPIH